jgi:hypothetical protein
MRLPFEQASLANPFRMEVQIVQATRKASGKVADLSWAIQAT